MRKIGRYESLWKQMGSGNQKQMTKNEEDEEEEKEEVKNY